MPGTRRRRHRRRRAPAASPTVRARPGGAGVPGGLGSCSCTPTPASSRAGGARCWASPPRSWAAPSGSASRRPGRPGLRRVGGRAALPPARAALRRPGDLLPPGRLRDGRGFSPRAALRGRGLLPAPAPPRPDRAPARARGEQPPALGAGRARAHHLARQHAGAAVPGRGGPFPPGAALQWVSPPMTSLGPGSTFSHYRIVDTLGQGGQATAFKAEDLRLNRTVVIKTLKPDLASSDTARARFEREAQLCSALDNPNIQGVYDVGETDGLYYIVLQYVEGPTLKQFMGGRPLETLSALSIAIQLADALAVAHAQRHRAPRPQARQRHRRARGPGEGARLRPRQDAGARRRGGRRDAALEDRRPADRGRRALRLDGLQLPRAGVGPGRRPPHRRLQPGRRALRDGHRDGALPRAPRGRGAERGDQRHPAPDRDLNPRALRVLQPILDRAMAKAPRDRYQTMAALRDELKALMRRLTRETGVVPTEASATLLEPQRARATWSLSGTLGRVLGRLRPPRPPAGRPARGPPGAGAPSRPAHLGHREAPHRSPSCPSATSPATPTPPSTSSPSPTASSPSSPT